MGSFPVPQPYRVLIAGGAYGGVSAAVNLLDLSLGRSARLDPDKAPAEEARNGVPIEIHIVDERDGYCESVRQHYPIHIHWLILTLYTRPHHWLTSCPFITGLCDEGMAEV